MPYHDTQNTIESNMFIIETPLTLVPGLSYNILAGELDWLDWEEGSNENNPNLEEPIDDDGIVENIDGDGSDHYIEVKSGIDIDVTRILNFSDSDASEYNKRSKFTAAFVRLYSNLWAVASEIKSTKNYDLTNISDHAILGLLEDLRDDINLVSSYEDDGKNVLNILLPFTDNFKQAMTITDDKGNVLSPPPSSYKDALVSTFVPKTRSNKMLVAEKIDALFKDLSLHVSSTPINPNYTKYLGDKWRKALKNVVKSYNYVVKDLACTDKEYNTAIDSFDITIGVVHARHAYPLLLPIQVFGDSEVGVDGQPLTQREVRIALAKLYAEFFNIKNLTGKDDKKKVPLRTFLANSKIAVDDTALTAIQVGNQLYHSKPFASTKRTFTESISAIIKYYETMSASEPDNIRYSDFITLFETYKAKEKSLSRKLKLIYDSEVKYFFRANPGLVRIADYTAVYNWLKDTENGPGLEDLFGPKPYTLPVGADGAVGVHIRTKETGFYGQIDQNGNYYTAYAYDENDNIVGGGDLIRLPELSATVKVRMNPNYSIVQDNAYVYEVTLESGKTKRPATLNKDSRRKRESFNKLNKDYFEGMTKDEDSGTVILKQNTFREKWKHIIKTFFGTSGVAYPGTVPSIVHFDKMSPDGYKAAFKPITYAMLCELMYLTAMRVSHKRAASAGEKTFGAAMLAREHIEFTIETSGSHRQVVGAKITYPGKGNPVSGPVEHTHIIGRYTNATDSATKTNSIVTNIKQLKIAPAIKDDEFLPIFLFVLYAMWKFRYDYTSTPRGFNPKQGKTEKVFSFNWLGRGKGASSAAQVDDRGIGRFMKDDLGMETTAHAIRRFRGTAIAVNTLFSTSNIGDIPNYLAAENRQLLEFKEDGKTPRTMSSKQSLVKQYTDEVGRTVAHKLQHYLISRTKTTSAEEDIDNLSKQPVENPTTSIGNYINPVVFEKYFKNLNMPNPAWLTRLMEKFTN